MGTQDDGVTPRSVWTKLGAAWPNRDGKGFSIALEALPLDGRLVLREAGQQGDEHNDVSEQGNP